MTPRWNLIAVTLAGALSALACAVAIAASSWTLESEFSPQGRRPYVMHLDLAVNARGEAILTWVGCDGPPVAIPESARPACPELRAVSRSPRGRWDSIRTLHSKRIVAFESVAVDRLGNGLVVWVDGEQRFELRAAVKGRGRLGWSTPTNLSAACPEVGAYGFASNRRGDAAVIWACEAQLWGRVRSGATQRWSAARRLGQIARIAHGQLDVEMDARGNAVVVWVQCSSLRRCSPQSMRYAAARGAWSDRRRLPIGTTISELELAVNDAGEAVAAWVRSPWSAPDTVEVASGKPGGAWRAPVTIARGSPPDGFSRAPPIVSLAVAANGRGRFAAVWASDRAIEGRLHSRGAGWGPVRRLAQPPSGAPRLAADERGGFRVVWVRGVGSDVTIETTTVAPSGRWEAPTPIAVDQSLQASLLDVEAWGDRRAVAAWAVAAEPRPARTVRAAAR